MKNNGLRNRFDEDEIRSAWAFNYRCFWCDKSGFDCFHHIISPSSDRYIDGDFNSSILNSFPIHNFGCHLYNPRLHKRNQESRMLRKTIKYLFSQGYELKDIDKKFISVYRDLYINKNRGLTTKTKER
jgi:hypothetical protein